MLKELVIAAHEAKLNRTDNESKLLNVIESFGTRKYSNIVEQINNEKLITKQSTLNYLINELLNQESLVACIKEGLIEVVLRCLDRTNNSETRILGAKVLRVVCQSSIGCLKMIEKNEVSAIAAYIEDEVDEMKGDVLACLCHISGSCRGPEVLVRSESMIPRLVTALCTECKDNREVVLEILYNVCCNSENGFKQAVEVKVTDTLIDIICSTAKAKKTLTLALKTYAYFCFNEEVRNNAQPSTMIDRVFSILLTEVNQSSDGTSINDDSDSQSTQAAALLVLVALTLDSSGKRTAGEILLSETYTAVVRKLVGSKDYGVRLNIFKLLANVAVYPPAREHLLSQVALIDILVAFTSNNADDIAARHAKVLLDTLRWTP